MCVVFFVEQSSSIAEIGAMDGWSMKAIQSVIIAILGSCCAVGASAQPEEKICLMYCPVDSAQLSCEFSWSDSGDECTCTCRGIQLPQEETDQLDVNPLLKVDGVTVVLDRVGNSMISLRLMKEESGFNTGSVQGLYVNEGGGDAPDPVEKPTAQDVKDLLDAIIVHCTIRGGC